MLGAAAGIALKCVFPRRFEYAGLVLCVAIGLSGLMTLGPLHTSMSAIDFGLLVAGACVYLIGVGVLLLPGLRFTMPHGTHWC
jgi:hemolysin III